jgi:hypothetical protein
MAAAYAQTRHSAVSPFVGSEQMRHPLERERERGSPQGMLQGQYYRPTQQEKQLMQQQRPVELDSTPVTSPIASPISRKPTPQAQAHQPTVSPEDRLPAAPLPAALMPAPWRAQQGRHGGSDELYMG